MPNHVVVSPTEFSPRPYTHFSAENSVSWGARLATAGALVFAVVIFLWVVLATLSIMTDAASSLLSGLAGVAGAALNLGFALMGWNEIRRSSRIGLST